MSQETSGKFSVDVLDALVAKQKKKYSPEKLMDTLKEKLAESLQTNNERNEELELRPVFHVLLTKMMSELAKTGKITSEISSLFELREAFSTDN